MSALSLVLVSGVAAFFFVMGVVALAHPERVVATFGTVSLTRDGRSEVRAVYGGFGIGIALLLLATLGLPGLASGTLVTVAVALAGMAAGRLFSALLDGSPGPAPWLFFGVELVLAAALLVALQLG